MHFVRQRFESCYHDRVVADLDDVHFERCTFFCCSYAPPAYAPGRPLLSNVSMEGCRIERGIRLGNVRLRDVLVRDLRCTAGPFLLHGTTFERVTIAGRIDTLVLNGGVWEGGSGWPPGVLDGLQAEADAVYADLAATGGWALDVSRVECKELTLRNIPPDLVRRDRDTQAVVRLENLVGRDWEAIDFEGTYFRAGVRAVAIGDYPADFLITPLRAKNPEAFMRVIGRLRDAGIADQD